MSIRALVGGGRRRIRAESGGTFVLTPYLGQVATRSFVPNTRTGATNYANSRTAHEATQAITSLQVKFPGWYVNSTGNGVDTAGAALTYTPSVEYPAGTFTQIKWAGSASVTTNGTLGDTGLSDACTVAIPNGAQFWVRNFAFVTSGTGGGLCVLQAVTSTRWTAAGEAFASSGTVIGDLTMGGTVTDGGTGTFIYPLCIVATTSQATFFLLGDSRTVGTTSGGVTTPDAHGNLGQAARSIGNAAGFINCGVGGSYLSVFNTQGSQRLALAQYCSHIIPGYGINDIRTGGGARTAAQLEADFATLARKVPPSKTLFICTIDPQTTSTDAWATAANQTADPLDAQRQAANTFLKALPSPFSACIDIAASGQDAGDPTKWKSPSWTADGLHRTDTGYAGIVSAGVINVATLGAIGPISRYSPFVLSQKAVIFDVGRASVVSATVSGTVGCEGNGYIWTAPVNVPYAATGFNGGPALTFTGASNIRMVGDATMFAAFNGVPGITLAMLLQVPSFPATTRCLMNVSTNGTTERATLYLSSTGIVTLVYRCLDADAATTLTAPSALLTNTNYLIEGNLDPVNNVSQLVINGVVVASGTFVTSGVNFSATNSSRVAIATQITGDTQLSMTLREADFFPVAMPNTLTRQKMEGDIAWRAGAASSVLPANHPYFNSPPTSN